MGCNRYPDGIPNPKTFMCAANDELCGFDWYTPCNIWGKLKEGSEELVDRRKKYQNISETFKKEERRATQGDFQ